MYKFLIIVPVLILLWKDFQVFQIEGRNFIVQLGILSSCWIILSVFSFVFEIPRIFSIFFLIRGLIYFILFMYTVIRLKLLSN